MDDSYILCTIFNHDPSKPGSTEFFQIVFDENLTKKFEVNDYVIVDKNEKDDGDETSSYEVISS